MSFSVFNIIGNLTGFNSSGGNGIVLDANAQAYIAAAGFTNPSLITGINNFYVSAKDLSVYSKFKVLYLFITESTTGATQLMQFKWNALNPIDDNAAFRLTPVNTPTTSQAGTSGNGTTQYWETYFNFNTVMPGSANSMGLMANYIGNTLAVSGAIDVSGAFAKASQVILNNGTSTNGSVNSNVGTTSVRPSACGFFAANRESGNQKIYYNGFYENNSITTMQGLPATHTANILRRNGATPFYGTSGLNFFAIYDNCTETDVLNIMSLGNTLQGVIETSLGLAPGSRKKY